jgi:hypothetical protein
LFFYCLINLYKVGEQHPFNGNNGNENFIRRKTSDNSLSSTAVLSAAMARLQQRPAEALNFSGFKGFHLI